MSEHYSYIEQAEGKIQLALSRLAAEYPFHVQVLERFQVKAWPAVNTMGVTVDGDDILLLHNPAFVLEISAPELGGVLLHEVHHVVFEHVLADPTDFPDEWARTVAEETTVNEFVREPLPGNPITLEDFPDLPPLESTRQRYDRLKRVTQRQSVTSPVLLDAQQGGGEGRVARSGQQEGQGQSGQQDTARQQRLPTGQDRATDPNGVLQTLDDHKVWQQARQDLARARGIIRDVVSQSVLVVGPGEIPPELQAALKELGIGHAPGEAHHQLTVEAENKLDWRRLLRRYIGQVVQVRPVFNRPPRRFPELVGLLPGKQRQVAKPKIMAVIDTSGSITPQLLEDINAELAGLAKHYQVLVVECDAAIQRTYPYKPLKDVCGRGGTDLRPPLEAIFLRQHRPDLAIFFTDGYGPAPRQRPELPLIWCLVPGGMQPTPWGRVIRMDSGVGGTEK